MSFTAVDHAHMAAALRLARKGLFTADPNPRVGCVIAAADGTELASGWHERAGGPHAEAAALQALGSGAAAHTAYVTLEPCAHHGRTPPCADALVEAGLQRVVFAVNDPNPLVAGKGAERLRAAGVRVESGLLEAEAVELNRGFIKRMRTGRPWVTVKLATSLDGRTALAGGESKWLTCAAARNDVHRGRARSSAVLTGRGTIALDDPRLNCRLADQAPGTVQQPLRVVADSKLSVTPAAELFRVAGPVLMAHATGTAAAADALEQRGAELVKLGQDESGHVDLHELISLLGKRGCNEIWVEAGATLNGALLAAGLVDELLIYQASSVLGDDGRGMFALPPLLRMEDRLETTLAEVRRVGTDLRLRYSLGAA